MAETGHRNIWKMKGPSQPRTVPRALWAIKYFLATPTPPQGCMLVGPLALPWVTGSSVPQAANLNRSAQGH